MKQRLTQYIDLLFAGVPDAEDIKQEILQNTLDRYDDLIAQGKSPEAAYSLAISGIGDVSEILGSAAGQHVERPEPAPPAQAKPEKSKESKLITAVAIAFFILCPVPLLILENTIGLCLLLAMVAAGVGLLVFYGKGDAVETKPPVGRSALNKGINRLLFGCGFVCYFVISFYTNAWYITWLVFPIIGCSCQLVNACFDLNKVFVSAFIRILIFGVLILLLIAAIVGTCLGVYITDNFWGQTTMIGGETASAGSVSAQEVSKLDIQWVSGSIIIQPDDVTDIQFSEPAGLSESQKLVWSRSGDTLVIQFCRPTLFSWNLSLPSKDLVIKVPQDWFCEALDIDSVSARIRVEQLVGLDADLINVSGSCEFTDCAFSDFSADTVSGKVTYTGSLDTLKFDTVSANCIAQLNAHPDVIDLNAVSGNCTLYLPADCGFTVSLDSVSGDFSSDFATTSSNNRYTYGSGTCNITADSVSGDVHIRSSQNN